MNNPNVEVITDGGIELAYIVAADFSPIETTFLTPGKLPLQMGMIVYGAGKTITPHVHLPYTRTVEGTTECVIVRKGVCQVDIFTEDRRFVTTRTLTEGSIILLLGGGHGFRMSEDTLLFEVKQGPYAGDADKARF
jgi:hypothetical protein